MEKWIKWEPTKDLSGKYHVISITWPEDGIIIKLSDVNNTKKIEIKFEYFVDAYRYTHESFCFKIFSDLSNKYGTEFYKEWSFFKINNSKYVEWVIEKSYDSNFIHFSIIGNYEIIDIIAGYDPEIKVIK
jgi:hypothetical protein